MSNDATNRLLQAMRREGHVQIRCMGGGGWDCYWEAGRGLRFDGWGETPLAAASAAQQQRQRYLERRGRHGRS